MDTTKVSLSSLYARRLSAMREDKRMMNRLKIKEIGRGRMDFDDWGFIHYPDFHFTMESERADGVICGYLPIGRTLRRFMNEIPKYINKNSSLGGAWIGSIANYVDVRMAPEDFPTDLARIWKEYDTHPGFGGMNHCAPDMNIGLELGWGGLLHKIRHYRRLNRPADPAFYDGEEQVVLGMQEYITGLAEEGRRLAQAESDPADRRNLLDIADMNEWLVENRPRTLREACQFLAHFQILDRTYFLGGALQQLDELLRPYYEEDTAAGILSDEEALWHIASLFYNDTHYSQIAGLTPDGSQDLTSRLSFIILDALHQLRIPTNVAIRVHDGVNAELLRRSLEYTMEDGTGVDYSLNIGCEEGYARNGHPLQLARQRAKVGCNWTALPGREYPLQDVTRANLASALVHALDDFRSDEPSMEDLFDRFDHHTRIIVESIKAGYDHHYEVIGRNLPEVCYNLFMHGPVERGLNCSEGGVDILDLNIDGVALATVADSFAAIEQRVIQERRISWEQLHEVLDKNYEDAEDIRLMMKNIHRFGSPDSLAEAWAVRIRDCFVKACRASNTPKHHLPIIPGMFSHGTVKELGRNIRATPNGRKSGEAISHSNEPDPGFARGLDSFSPSLKASAVAKTQPGYGNSAPLHLDIDTDMLKGEAGLESLIALIHAHNHMGGTLINLNCLTKETLQQAHEDPDSFPDLIVRVTGYSAYFSSLSKDYRQQIIDRFLSNDER